MGHMLKALGFWIWGLVAIGLAASFVPLAYRVAELSRWRDTVSSSAPLRQMGSPSMGPRSAPPSRAIFMSAPASEFVSRRSDKEMSGARQALQAGQWSDALDSSTAAEAKAQRAYAEGLTSQDYFQRRDCANTALWGRRAIADYRALGEPPPENLYRFQLQCASDRGDKAAMVALLYDLILLTHRTAYWNTLLRIERQDERDDRSLLNIYRLMFDTHAMTAESDYMEMAQLLGDAALPGEAVRVLDSGIDAGVVLSRGGGRIARLKDALTSRADSDKRDLAIFPGEVDDSANRDLALVAGEVRYGVGDFQGAVVAIETGLAKGRIQHLAEAYVYLGRAYVALHDTAAAAIAFTRLKTVPLISQRVVTVWTLYAQTLVTPDELAASPLATAANESAGSVQSR